MTYPYDPDLRDYVARLLYDALPAFYKAEDERARMRQPPDPAELEQFIRALAAPLAAVRQSIEELYADFFIDSANDWVLPYLARMAGTSLVFPDADFEPARRARHRRLAPAQRHAVDAAGPGR